MKPCILCADPTSVSETFIRRHIRLLNKGDTIVFGEVPRRSEDLPEPMNYVPALHGRTTYRRLVRGMGGYELGKMISGLAWKAGLGKSEIFDQIDYLIFEFGYILVRNWDFALFSGKPFFVYFRGIDASRLLNEDKYVASLRQLLPAARGAVFVAPALRRQLEKKGIPLPKTAVIPSGVDTKAFVPNFKDKNTFASIGRFVEKKAHSDTLHAFKAVRAANSDAQLHLVGDGPMLPEMKRLARDLGLEGAAHFSGAMAHSGVRELLGRAAFYLQSSKPSEDGDCEGFPSSIQEALSSGCVVCSTDHSGAADFLKHGENALLNREGDWQQMTTNILGIFNTEAALRQLARNARELAVSEFDADECIERFETFVARNL